MSYECVCDYDSPTVYERSTRKARKLHKCEECGRAISPGESYEYVFSVFDGDTWVCKTCPRCLALRDFVLAHIPCSCWAHGNMIEDIMNDAQQWAHEAPGLLFGAYRRKVLVDRGVRFHG